MSIIIFILQLIFLFLIIIWATSNKDDSFKHIIIIGLVLVNLRVQISENDRKIERINYLEETLSLKEEVIPLKKEAIENDEDIRELFRNLVIINKRQCIKCDNQNQSQK